MNIKSKGYTLNIEVDDDPINPRENFKPLGKMLCWHGRYNLGDSNPYPTSQGFWDDKSLQEDIFVLLKVYGYDHGGMCVSHNPYSCLFDSGTLGVIYATKQDVLDNFGNLNETTKNTVSKYLIGEISEYNDYLTSTYYQYSIYDENGKLVDLGGTFTGDNMQEILEDMQLLSENEYSFLFDELLLQQNQIAL